MESQSRSSIASPPLLGMAFVGPVEPSVFRSAASETVLRSLQLRPTPPSRLDAPAGEVRAFEPFLQEDVERALEGVSAVVVGLPVPVPSAAVVQERERDSQSFVIDGLIAAAEARGIRHVAVVGPDRETVTEEGQTILNELGRIIRAYGMDVLDVPRGESGRVMDAVERWIRRCALHAKRSGVVVRARGTVTRRPATGPGMRSLQRLVVPRGWDAGQLSRAYAEWLGRAYGWGLRTEVEANGSFRIFSRFSPRALLELEAVECLDAARRRVLVVGGGALAAEGSADRGWMEFRVLPGGKDAIVAVGDFVPRLPWAVYRATQAPAHKHVMQAFAAHLAHMR